MIVDGYEAEEQEITALVAAVVGAREEGDDELAWFAHLSSRLALLQAVCDTVAQERDAVAASVVGRLEGTAGGRRPWPAPGQAWLLGARHIELRRAPASTTVRVSARNNRRRSTT